MLNRYFQGIKWKYDLTLEEGESHSKSLRASGKVFQRRGNGGRALQAKGRTCARAEKAQRHWLV